MDDLEGSLDFSEAVHHVRTIIHIDLDCFYAQVEMIKNPSLRNEPLGVQQKNIVVTCNYIAREFGVKKCMQVSQALELCPSLMLVRGEDLHDYRQMSTKVTQLLQTFTPYVEKLGLDENFVDVTQLIKKKLEDNFGKSWSTEGHVYGNIYGNCECGCSQRLSIGSQIASEMRKLLKDELELTSCAGISYNKLLSKLVCSTHKPNQQTILYASGVMHFLSTLTSVRSIPGIGQRMYETLSSIGINSVSDLQKYKIDDLKNALGHESGIKIKKLSFGIDETAVKQTGKPQSIGIEDGCRKISLESDVKDKFSILLQRLMILQAEDGRIPGSIKVTVRKYDNIHKTSHRESKQCNIPSSLFSIPSTGVMSPKSSEKLMNLIMKLFHKMVDISKPFHLTLVGLAFTKFQERCSGKNSIASFLVKDISVQSVTSFKNVTCFPEECASTSYTTSMPMYLLNSEKSGSESEPEPSPKKKKRRDLPFLGRKRTVCVDDEDDESPCKLRVSELRLNSSDSPDEMPLDDTQQSRQEKKSNNFLTKPSAHSIPHNIDKDVFQALPSDIQAELMQSWTKENNSNDTDGSTSFAEHKSKQKTLLNFFIPSKK